MYQQRIRHLELGHSVLDKQIDGMEKTGKYTDAQIAELKKKRLQIRDEIAKLKLSQSTQDQNHG